MILTDFPAPTDSLPEYLDVPSPDGPAMLPRAEVPRHVEIVHQAVHDGLDTLLGAVPSVLDHLATHYTELADAEREQPGYLGQLVGCAIRAWTRRAVPDPDDATPAP
jgi:hypothetical protein